MPPPGLYDPRHEHDGCGVACIARLDGQPAHETVSRAIEALVNLEHRGAEGADAETGDGAGILVQLPDAFLRAAAREALEIDLPPAGRYAVAVCMLAAADEPRRRAEAVLERLVAERGQEVLGWRDIPVEHRHAGARALECAPVMRQLFVGAGPDVADRDAFERRLYVIRRLAEAEAGDDLVIASLSSRTMVLKGMLSAPQLPGFYPDLTDPRLASALAIVHSRFSTNTFPSWGLAHPYRMVAHNGEFNTLRGNVNWMRARERRLHSELFGDELAALTPVVQPGASDSASFDNVLELLVLAGRPIAHAVMMLVPEAWEARDDIPDELAGFYAHHEQLMEPWDGPASITFSDGCVLGARLDRNGLRPGRWAATDDGWVTLGSETGAFPLEPERVVRRGRLRPGTLFVVDTQRGRLMADREAELEVARRRPYGRWAADGVQRLEDLPAPDGAAPADPAEPRTRLRLAFGYTREDLDILIGPLAAAGKEPTGSMGNDAALAALSDRSPSLFAYFKQLFAQVTNPAIDSLREDVVMSLATALGPAPDVLDEGPPAQQRILLDGPVLDAARLGRIAARAVTLDCTWAGGAEALAPALDALCERAGREVDGGAAILVLSDRAVGPQRAPIPALLATAAVHHHLVRAGTRLRASLVVDSGEPREVHHLACLVGFGADAVHPWLLFATVEDLVAAGELAAEAPVEATIKGLEKGLLKTMSKMGISTVSSYRGAQAFEIIGLDRDLVERHFTGSSSRLGGLGLDGLAREALDRHGRAYGERPPGPHGRTDPPALPGLPVGGLYRWRRDGERHGWSPETVVGLQRAIGEDGAEAWGRYSRAVDDEARRRRTLRGLLAFSRDVDPIDVSDVEPAADIMRRFATGGMSLGSISPETHETLAIAMNRIGGKSNTGEGGEDSRRYTRDPNGDLRRSAIKQVASGRFGVTTEYLSNADELQIKIAQGAKPGEGGQLPGHKVDDYIGKLRHATPGVELISPPPHHDIYSIEDLKQLIYDLRCANPNARISVKLTSEEGVGTVAAGVVKAHADHVVIPGHDGGTGASPQSSIQHAGIPWELGLAETQQTLVRNGLRGRIVVQADGGMRTGRDVVIAALLGAEEIGFSTAPLIALGCIMMRVCHLNTCPVGIATQDPELRRRYAGQPEQVVRFFALLAEEARAIMAGLGIARWEDLVGRVDLLERDAAVEDGKARGLDLSPLLAAPEGDGPRRRVDTVDAGLEDHLDHGLLAAAEPAIERGEPVQVSLPVANRDRAVGGLLSGVLVRRRGPDGLPEGTVEITLTGSAGQSCGAWLAPGITLTVRGDVNDYAGKGMSGGVLAVMPEGSAIVRAEEDVIAGNTTLYGATSGRAFFRGLAGERFAVRNSGACTVVEGVGDHGCEYMTGGRVVVLGQTGRNFAAGMSGGIAYVLDDDGGFAGRCNTDLVDLLDVADDDREELHALVAEHAQRTGSARAEALLEDWDGAVERFVKVMPRDYARVLEERAEAAKAAA